MPLTFVKLTYFGAAAELARRNGVSQVGFRNARRATLIGMGEEWQQNYLDRHFEMAAYRRYHYTPRRGAFLPKGSREWKRSYSGRKWMEQGHNRPLEYSGVSRMLAQTGRVTGTSNKSTVTIPAPALNYKNPTSEINMRDEVTRVNAFELRTLERHGEQRMAEELKRVRATRPVRIR